MAILGAAVAFVALITWYGSRQFSERAADSRASNEAMSFAAYSSRVATGDAFDGYIQILRYADDPVINNKTASATDRSNAMQQLLYLNVNKFDSLTIVDRAGIMFATTDSRIATVKDSQAFADTRANLGPANSDIVLPEAGKRGYVEYTAPLRDPDGSVWGILLGRADPARIWAGTLVANVDGSTNVIINSQGQFAAGVSDTLLRLPWQGQTLANGGVRANIGGFDSICGLAPIGRDTQIDRGLNVASCLPASIIQIERGRATNKQGLITFAGAVLAIVVGATLLKLTSRGALADAPPASDRDAVDEPDADLEVLATVIDELPPPIIAIEGQDPIPPPDVDAVSLIEAYEQRNARLAERIRESVQAKLLLAETQAEEAYRLAGVDHELAAVLHTHAMSDLEEIRDRELRSIGQELYPSLIRLGLAGAFNALRKEMADVIDIRLDIEQSVDSVSGGAGRLALAPALRLVLYRFVAESARKLAVAEAPACAVTLRRHGDMLEVDVSAHLDEDHASGIDAASLRPIELSIEAYGGTLAYDHRWDQASLRVDVPAHSTAVTEPDTPEAGQEDEELEDANLAAESSATLLDPGLIPVPGLRLAVEGLQAEFFGTLVVAVDIAEAFNGEADAILSDASRGAVIELARRALIALRDNSARHATLSVERLGAALAVDIQSDARVSAEDTGAMEEAAAAARDAGLTVDIAGEGLADGFHLRATADTRPEPLSEPASGEDAA